VKTINRLKRKVIIPSNVIVLFICLLVPSQASAFYLEAALATLGTSVAVDKAGDELRDVVNHAKAAAGELIGHMDDVAKRRLEQIDEILESTVGGLIEKTDKAALNAIAKAKKDVL